MADLPDTRTIPLTQGQVAIVDAADFERLSQWKWYAHLEHNGYRAYRQTPRVEGRQRTQSMHRAIIDAPASMMVDHINHDPLDNRRANLRLCTRIENGRNRRGSQAGSSSQFLGVSWHKGDGKWHARIAVNRRPKLVGSFTCEIAAALAYDAAARELFGEFANPNFPLTANHSAPQEQQP